MIPKTVSHYEVLEKLGGGGMGVVYKARDTRLDRIVALKFLPAHASDNPVAQERFFQEARAASALDHRNICTIHDFGSSEEGELFIAMAYYPGETLKRKLDRGRLPVAEALDVAIQMAEGLARAHEAGIVHRDVKPANAIVTDRGEVKLLDFGLAKLPDRSMTATGTLMGTAAYMSPEQVRGEKIDDRTDVWSLGVVLYEMLKGEPPFRGESSPTLLRAIEQETPPSLGEAPEELSRIVDRALEKDAARRYRSMMELLDDLEAARLALGFSDLSSAPTMAALEPSRGRRSRGYVVAAAAAVVALGAFAYFSYQRSARARWAREEALPEIERLADAMSYMGEAAFSWPAVELAREASSVIPRDPLLEKLWQRIACTATFESEPPGAQVYVKRYSAPNEEWVALGRAPLRDVRLPLGFLRFRMELDGHRTVEDLLWLTDSGEEFRFDLAETGVIPDEMVPFSAETPSVRLAGLDYLEAEPIPPYFMDRHEVTNRQFKRFVDAGGYGNQEFWKEPFIRDGRTLSWVEAMSFFKDKTGRPGPATWEVGDYSDGQDDYPVSGVSWYEAAAYAAFAGKSLPTIFHWNQAALAWAAAEIVPMSNFSGAGPASVGSHAGMTRRGTFDLAGNVREWCWNRTGSGDELRFILGGGWNDPAYAFTDAYAQSPWDRSETNGFRCIRYGVEGEKPQELTRVVELPFRDYRTETPVSDATFQIYLAQYLYDRTELSPFVEQERDHEDWIVQKVSFGAAYGGERMFAYLFLPKKTRPPYQTVIFFPGSNAITTRSSSESRMTEEQLLFDFVLKSGRAFLFPIYKGTYERGDTLKSDYPDETSFYKDHVIMWVKDFSRSIDYLETRDDIDPGKLAYLGFSWGGGMGAIVPAVEKRVDAVVLWVAGLYFQKALPEVDGINYVTRARQPTIMINGEYDFFFPLETSQRPMFEFLGTPEKDKKWVVFPGSHSVPREDLIRETLDWLDRYLGPVS